MKKASFMRRHCSTAQHSPERGNAGLNNMACLMFRTVAMHNYYLLVVVIALGSLHLASATQYTVGDDKGWSLMDYTAWARSKTFNVGDILYFPYEKNSHDVAQVSTITDYNTCSASDPINQWANGDTKVTLNSTGDAYFICTFLGHCPPMRLAITVGSSTSTTNYTTTITSSPNLASFTYSSNMWLILMTFIIVTFYSLVM